MRESQSRFGTHVFYDDSNYPDARATRKAPPSLIRRTVWQLGHSICGGGVSGPQKICPQFPHCHHATFPQNGHETAPYSKSEEIGGGEPATKPQLTASIGSPPIDSEQSNKM